ncbi:MAG: hypothetical protein V7603_5523 [Micromonosporaceae bacterium]
MLPLLAGVGVLAQWPLVCNGNLLLVVANSAVSLAFYAAAEFVAGETGHRRTATAFLIASVATPLNWLNEWGVGPLPLVASVLGPLSSLVGSWGLLRYPVHWSDVRQERAVLAWFAAVQVCELVGVVTSRPQWHGFPADAWWPTVAANHTAWNLFGTLYPVVTASTAVTVAVLLGYRVSRLSGLDRRAMAPVALAVAGGAVLTVAANAVFVMRAPDNTLNTVYAVQGILFVIIPVSLLVAAVRRWAAPESGRLVRHLARAGGRTRVQEVLREALADPTLQLLYRADGDGYVDVSGAAAVPPMDESRLVIGLLGGDGEPRALLIADPALHRYGRLVGMAARTAELLLHNADLRTTAHGLSPTHLRTAVAAERQRAGRTVEEGLHHRLQALDSNLARLLPAIDDRAQAARIEEMRAGLRMAQRDLRDLAYDRHPDILAEGLAAAVVSTAEGTPTPVIVQLPAQRFAPETEACAYYVIAELLTNARKYAGAGIIEVLGRIEGDTLGIDVRDDGVGGADRDGHGLRGVRSRVMAAGGTMTLDSPVGGGTRVGVCIPVRSRTGGGLP